MSPAPAGGFLTSSAGWEALPARMHTQGSSEKSRQASGAVSAEGDEVVVGCTRASQAAQGQRICLPVQQT